VLNENNGLQRRGSQFDGGMDCVSEIFYNLKSPKLNGVINNKRSDVGSPFSLLSPSQKMDVYSRFAFGFSIHLETFNYMQPIVRVISCTKDCKDNGWLRTERLRGFEDL
jgi:hypothetical protein